MTSAGWSNNQYESQDILTTSIIRKKAIPKVFRDIKKTLPQKLKKCPVVVVDIRLLEAGDDRAEDWTINVCQEKRTFFVYAYSLKGSYFCIVKSKEEQFTKEQGIWNAAKKSGDEKIWQKALFYIDEIESKNK